MNADFSRLASACFSCSLSGSSSNPRWNGSSIVAANNIVGKFTAGTAYNLHANVATGANLEYTSRAGFDAENRRNGSKTPDAVAAPGVLSRCRAFPMWLTDLPGDKADLAGCRHWGSYSHRFPNRAHCLGDTAS